VFSTLFSPPKKINKTYYRCDRKFHLDNILEMYKSEVTYGIIFMAGNKIEFHKLVKTGTNYQNVKLFHKNIVLPSQHKTGGQSAVRFERLRDEAINDYVNQMSEMCVKHFMIENNTQSLVKGLIIAGPGLIKNDLLKNDLFNLYFKNLIIGCLVTKELNDKTIFDTIDEAKNIIEKNENKDIIKSLDKIKQMISLADNKLTFGHKDIVDGLNSCIIEEIYVDDTFDKLDQIKEMINYDCKINLIPSCIMNEIGINIVGIRYY